MFPSKLLILLLPESYILLFNVQVKDTEKIMIIIILLLLFLLCQFFLQLTLSVIQSVKFNTVF